MKQILVTAFCFLVALSSAANGEEKSWKSPGVPKSPSDFWTPPPGKAPELTGASPIPASPEIQSKVDWTLTDLIDFALDTGYSTRASWHDAKAAAAEMMSLKGEYYPDIDVIAELGRIKGSAIGGQFSFSQNTFEPSVSARWVLFDFGKRGADVDEARMALLSADWTHNSEIQKLILQVQRAYYGYIGSKALILAQEASIESAKTALDAARQRHEAGLATIADVLQAQTSLSEVEFEAATTRGTIQILRGTLAIAIGMPPARAAFEVVDELPRDLPLDQISSEVFNMIQEGFAHRPDLAAAKYQALASEAHVRSLHAERFPVIETSGSMQRLFYIDPSGQSNNYSAFLSVRFPLFDGFSRKYDELQAKEETSALKNRVITLQQEIGLDIWTSYFRLTTAGERIKSTRKLMESAQESYEVASGRYKEGVGSILDVLAAQSALEDARAQDVLTRTEWLLFLAQLQNDIGILGMDEKKSFIFRNEQAMGVHQ